MGKLRWVLGSGLVAAAAALAGLRPYLLIGSAYAAKILCDAIFVSGRDPAAVLAVDVAGEHLWPLRYLDVRVDRSAGSVRCSALGFARRTAVFRPGLGAVLALGPAGRGAFDLQLRPGPRPVGLLPRGDAPPALARTIAGAFEEPDPQRPRRTRAVVVVHGGRVVGEGYAPGVTRDTPLLGWSMSKSAVNALVGILVGRGTLELGRKGLLPEWSAQGDPRSEITLEHLLRMTSGLAFREDYGDPLADVTTMLFATGDASGYALAKPLAAPPGSCWSYSSGTTNILCRVVRETFGSDLRAYLALPREALFDPLGMSGAVLEPDASGTFLGSSFLYATALDWARLGQLYLQDGVWNGVRILPAGWVRFSRTPTPESPDGVYGAHLWLELGPEFRPSGRELPADAFHFVGHEGQLVTVIPSAELVVVRLGLTRSPGAWDHGEFVASVLTALAR